MPCYLPDGTQVTIPVYEPCNSVSGQHSMCCALNQTNPTPDICLPNGVCQWENDGQIEYFRDSCSDPTWKSPYCLNVCTGPGQSDYQGSGRLSLCENGEWCCSSDGSSACCISGDTFTIADVIGSTSSTTQSSTQSTSTVSTTQSTAYTSQSAISTSQSTTTSMAPPAATQHNGLSTGAKVGIGVGVPVAVLLAAIAVALFLLLRRRGKQEAGQSGAYPAGYQPTAFQEMSSPKPPAELPAAEAAFRY